MDALGDGITSSLRERIQFLEQPESYPDHPSTVQIIQTHTSVVALAGSRAYKMKKPVNYEFLDFSTLEKRKYYCIKEIELNSRLCPDIYLGILPIYSNDRGLYFSDNLLDPDSYFKDEEYTSGDPIVEYVVMMKRLSDKYFLSHKILHDNLQEQDLQRTARKLVKFYQNQSVPDNILQWGRIEIIQQNIQENFDQTQPFVGSLIRPAAHTTIQHFTQQYLRQHANLFQQRIKNRSILDGHGDLHLDHIHASPEGLCIYDCIEFNERFRYQDIANDIAFLAMDLDLHEKFQLSRKFILWMAEMLDDQNLIRLIDFYKCYRAVVRGKVEAFKIKETEISPSEKEKARELVRRYLYLALRYAVIGSEPIALVIMGRIGTGKSTLSTQLARELDLERFNSDRIRKELAGLPVREPSPKSIHDYLYSSEMSDHTYNEMMERSLEQLRNGHSVILDATFSRRNKRNELRSKLDEIGASYYFIEMQTTDDRIKDRLKKRDEFDHIISDARLENFQPLNKIYQPPTELPSTKLLSMDTAQPVAESAQLLLTKLVDAHIKDM